MYVCVCVHVCLSLISLRPRSLTLLLLERDDVNVFPHPLFWLQEPVEGDGTGSFGGILIEEEE